MPSFVTLLSAKRVFLSSDDYTIINSTMYVSVSGKTSASFGKIVREKSISKVVFNETVDTIGDESFSNCPSLKEIELGSSIKTICNSAFKNCFGLEKIEFTGDSTINEINDTAFAGCKSLTIFTIPKSLTLLGKNVFLGCDSLSEFQISGNNEHFSIDSEGSLLFEGNLYKFVQKMKKSIVNHDLETGIHEGAYENSLLTEYETSLKVVPANAFENSIFLEKVKLISSTSIGKSAFSGCKSLNEVVLSSSTKTIEDDAFFGCVSLKTFEIPASVESLGSAFTDCTGVVLSVADGSKFFEVSDNLVLSKDHTILVYVNKNNLTKLEVPEGITTVRACAFQRLTNLQEIVIPSSVKELPLNVFKYCEELTKATINSTDFIVEEGIILSSDRKSIYKCINKEIKEVTINASFIAARAFSGCSMLEKVKINSSKVEQVNENPFFGCSNLTAIVDNEPSEDHYIAVIDGLLVTRSSGAVTLVSCPEGKYQTSFTIPDAVNIIADDFVDEAEFTSVKLGKEIFSISKEVFEKFDVTLGNSSYFKQEGQNIFLFNILFYSKQSEGNVVIPEGCISVSNNAFSKYTSEIAKVVVPTKTRMIHSKAFAISTIKEVSFEGESTIITAQTNAFADKNVEKISFSENITKIGENAFNGFSKVSMISIPDKVTSIGAYSFANCEQLATVVIGKSVEEIGFGAFLKDKISSLTVQCQSLSYSNDLLSSNSASNLIWFNASSTQSSITIEKTVAQMSPYLFANAANLKTVTFKHETLSNLPDGLFENCTALTNVNLPGEIQEFGAYCFAGCTSLEKITNNKPASSVTIKMGAFKDCSKLASFENLTNVAFIGSYAFYGTALTEVSLQMTSWIGVSAFENCKSITSLYLPMSLQTVNDRAFANCAGIKQFYFCSAIPITNNAFEGVSVVPDTAIDYKYDRIGQLNVSKKGEKCIPVYPTPQPTMDYRIKQTPTEASKIDTMPLTIGVASAAGVLLCGWVALCIVYAAKGKCKDSSLENNETSVV